MSRVYAEGRYRGCTIEQLAEMDRLAAEANQKKPGSATRESVAPKVLGLKVVKKKGGK